MSNRALPQGEYPEPVAGPDAGQRCANGSGAKACGLVWWGTNKNIDGWLCHPSHLLESMGRHACDT